MDETCLPLIDSIKINVMTNKKYNLPGVIKGKQTDYKKG